MPSGFPVVIPQSPLPMQCARCGTASTRACTACKNPPTSAINTIKLGNTYYCSPKCQKADWQNHKPICTTIQTRKFLWRSGALLQEIFYTYREIAFDKLIVKIEKRKDGKMFLHEGRYQPLRSHFDFLESFPARLCESEKDKHAVLAHLACDEASAWMYELIGYFLEAHAKIEELAVKVKNPKREVVAVSLCGHSEVEDFDHQILKITMNGTGEEYVLDLSGAQYGWHDPIIAWGEFVQSRLRAMCHPGIQSFGTRREKFLSKRTGKDQEAIIANINGTLSPELMRLTRDWEKKQNLTVEKALRLNDEALEEVRNGLVNHIKLGLLDSLRALRESDPGSRSQREALYIKSLMNQ